MKLNFTLVCRAFLAVGVAVLVATASATDVPKNMGNDLDSLVRSNIALKQAKASRTNVVTYNGFATERAANAAEMAIKDQASNRYLVDVHPSGRVPFEKLKENLLKRSPSFQITAVDKQYRGVGVIEGFVSVDDAVKLANTWGVTSVQLGIKPYVNRSKVEAPRAPAAALTLVGTTFDQGVTQHRVDKVSTLYDPSAGMSLDGTGMSIGLISDSFDTRTAAPHAATAVANFDLPGSGSNPYNTTPVAVLQDDAGAATDEGRGMCEIAYKMAPRAKLAFATADLGEVSFANNIRALAGISGFTYPNQTFAANSIADDVGYFDEPWYQDGIIAQGVDAAAAAGVAYFSSAANDIGTNAYTSPIRWVANGSGLTSATNTALVGTNINLTNVPTELYAGGFHNFNPNPGQQDVAQTWALPSGAQTFVMQWDDPYDQNTMAILDTPALYSNNGTITASPFTVTFTDIPALTAGDLYEIDCFQTAGNLDVTVTVTDPSNNTVVSQDNTVDEVVRFFAPVSGSGYKITIGRFSTTTGSFHLDLYHASGFVGGTLLTTDVNLLAFNASGTYLPGSSLTSNNFATNQPIELASIARSGAGLQFVVSRRNVPPAGTGPTHVRIQDGGNGAGGIAPVEYFTYDTVTTGGHPTARGCNGTAAYSVFRPSRPETFTSPGPAIMYFDQNNNRLATPEVRLQPRIAAADAGNTSFFASSDSTSDGDTNRNFSGTSAAGPHAAAIAALVLQAHGGPGSVTPAQMTNVLQNSVFQHDLDPLFVSGTATAGNGGQVNITLNSDSSSIGTVYAVTTGVGLQDKNSWKIAYSGPGYLTDLTFNPAGTAATAGSPTSGNNGVDATNTYFSNVYPGVVFEPSGLAFSTGTLNGLSAGDIGTPAFSNLAPLPSGANTFWTMAMTFPTTNFTGGKSFTFTVGRGQQHSSVVGTFAAPTGGAPFAGPNSGSTTLDGTADLLGGAVLIPEGTVFSTGMTFSGHASDGVTSFPFSGTMNNALGTGYTVQDGYGFINAQTAVTGSLVIPGPVTLSSVVSRKTHGGAGPFDVSLPGVECRDGGPTGDYTLVFTFANTLTSVGNAIIADGSATVSSTAVVGNTYIVNLTNVLNAQKVTVNAVDVHDSAGNVSATFPTTLNVLIGDTNANGTVNSGDVSQTKGQVGAVVGAGNFREDVTASGDINAGDVSDVKSHSGTALP